jgi:hypothetical protein
MHSSPNEIDPNVMALLGRLDERTRLMAEQASDTSTKVQALNTKVESLDNRFATRRELNLVKWLMGILGTLAASGVIALLAELLGRR